MKKVIIIYHKVDFDGVFSCCVARKFFTENPEYSEPELLGYTYGDPLPEVQSLTDSYDTIVMVDISFPGNTMIGLHNNMFASRKELVWIDHHVTAINDSHDLGYNRIPGNRTIGTAACELCWQYFYPSQPVPEIIRFVSSYDVWDKIRYSWTEVTMPVQLALRAKYGVWIESVWEDLDSLIYASPEQIEALISSGALISKYLERTWKSAVKNYSFEILVAGRLKGICIMSTEFSSNIFGSVCNDYDVMCVVNRRDHDTYSCSLYIEPERFGDFSAGEYLKANYGGGGHKGAAGCVLNHSQFERLICQGEI